MKCESTYYVQADYLGGEYVHCEEEEKHLIHKGHISESERHEDKSDAWISWNDKK